MTVGVIVAGHAAVAHGAHGCLRRDIEHPGRLRGRSWLLDEISVCGKTALTQVGYIEETAYVNSPAPRPTFRPACLAMALCPGPAAAGMTSAQTWTPGAETWVPDARRVNADRVVRAFVSRLGFSTCGENATSPGPRDRVNSQGCVAGHHSK